MKFTVTWLHLHKVQESIQYTNSSSKCFTVTFQLLGEPSQQGHRLITCVRTDVLSRAALVARLQDKLTPLHVMNHLPAGYTPR